MTSVYEAHGKYDVKVDPELCKAAVPWDGRRPGFHQCQRKATRDGWCHQHHPEAEAKRREKTRAEWEHKRNLRMLPWDKLEKANTLITHLEATNAELVAEKKNEHVLINQLTHALERFACLPLFAGEDAHSYRLTRTELKAAWVAFGAAVAWLNQHGEIYELGLTRREEAR